MESSDANKSIKDNPADNRTRPIKVLLENMEIKLVEEALMMNRGNVKKAAEYLEIPRQTLQQKMKKYKLK